jgi:hypothetical protein
VSEFSSRSAKEHATSDLYNNQINDWPKEVKNRCLVCQLTLIRVELP